jgi:hypothetical protein
MAFIADELMVPLGEQTEIGIRSMALGEFHVMAASQISAPAEWASPRIAFSVLRP